MSFTEYEGGEDEDFAFDLNDISSFLYSIGYLNKQKFHNIQKNLIFLLLSKEMLHKVHNENPKEHL